MMGSHDGQVDDLETLRRWEDFGATWEVLLAHVDHSAHDTAG